MAKRPESNQPTPRRHLGRNETTMSDKKKTIYAIAAKDAGYATVLHASATLSEIADQAAGSLCRIGRYEIDAEGDPIEVGHVYYDEATAREDGHDIDTILARLSA
jgi:hypothetical protein